MKKKILAIILSVIISLLLLSSTIQVLAKITWEEDFEGETIATLEEDFWDFEGYAWDPVEEVYNESIDHGFRVIDGILRAPNYQGWDESTGIYTGNYTRARRKSTVAYGTWSFDWVPPISRPDSQDLDLIVFIYNPAGREINLTDQENNSTSYSIQIFFNSLGETTRIILCKQLGPPSDVTLLGEYYIIPPVIKSIHIEITRDQQGHFKVYYNTNEIIDVTDNDITTSERFGLLSWVGDTGIDNITISIPDDSIPAIPASTVGYIIITVTPTIIILVIIRKRIIINNRYRNECHEAIKASEARD